MADKQKRKYTFKNAEYWAKARAPKKAASMAVNLDTKETTPWEPSSISLSRASSAYAAGSRGASSVNRTASSGRNMVNDSLNLLRDLPLPYSDKDGKIDIRDIVELCQRVYANISVFRNTIDIMTEFSCGDIYLTGGNAASKKFVNQWLIKIGADKLMEYFFRELYKTGNVFVLKFEGAFADEDFKKIKTALAAIKNKIPLRYTILNPAEIMIFSAASYDRAPYRKVLSEYELQALKDRKTDEDKAVWKSLPDEVKKQIETGGWAQDGLWMEIPSERLTAIFYKKQPYEPFAIPFGYPVLRDLNHKEELKKIDQAISRTIDNVILLVTMGAAKDQYGNGMNPAAMAKMQELLTTESVGRVLVSDWTTKMQFVIPEIGQILDPAKYKIVNEDINNGLLNILVGDEKYANSLMKTQIFLERLEEGRKSFMNFLQGEINALCKTVGFKAIPKVNLQEIELKDQVQWAKVYTRLMEIGVLTAEQGMKAIETGIFPEPEELATKQKEYIEERKDGLWNPLLGGVPQQTSPEQALNRESAERLGKFKSTPEGQGAGTSNPNATNNGRPEGSGGTPKSSTNPSPAGSSSASIAEIAKKKHLVSLTKLKSTAELTSGLMNKAEGLIKEKYKLTELNDTQKDLVYKLAANVMSTTKAEDWGTQIEAVAKEPEKYLTSFAQNEISEAVDKLAAEHQVDTYSASILYHSKWQQQ